MARCLDLSPLGLLLLPLALLAGGALVWVGRQRPAPTPEPSPVSTTESLMPPSVLQSRPVVVEVYYEVLCPDSRYFILKQLYPAWQKLGPIMDVRLKPYGKATHHANAEAGFTFQCQHGPAECQGNLVHTCAAQYVPAPGPRLDYIRCLMSDSYDALEAGRNCATPLAIDFEPIQTCALGLEGQRLMAIVGDETHALRPRVSFIPTIVLDGSQAGQKHILKDLIGEVCRKYTGPTPPNCPQVL